MVYSWPEHSQPQKPFPDLLCVGFGGFYVPWRKCCCSDAIVHENLQIFPELQEPFPLYSLQSSSWFQTVGNMLASVWFGGLGSSCCCCIFVAVVFLFVVLLWNIDYFSSILLWMFIHKRNVFVQVYPHRHCFSFTVAFNKAFLTWSCCVTLWNFPHSPLPISQVVWA